MRMTLTMRFAVSICSICLVIFGVSPAHPQDFPSKPVRILPGEAGGGQDVVARLLAQRMAGPLGQPVIVDNRPDLISFEFTSTAPPDGYNLLYASASLWVLPLIQQVSYNVKTDFVPITSATRSPLILIVSSGLPIHSIGDLISSARAHPGELNFATTGTGGNPHLAAELFKSMANVDLVRIPYKGSGAALNSLAAGDVQIMFATIGSGMPFVKSGKVRALAVADPQPSPLLPALPTIAASGLPGYAWSQIAGIFATGRTPADRVSRLNREIVRVLSNPEVKEKLATIGFEAVGSSPQEFAAAINADMDKTAKLVKDANIRGN